MSYLSRNHTILRDDVSKLDDLTADKFWTKSFGNGKSLPNHTMLIVSHPFRDEIHFIK